MIDHLNNRDQTSTHLQWLEPRKVRHGCHGSIVSAAWDSSLQCCDCMYIYVHYTYMIYIYIIYIYVLYMYNIYILIYNIHHIYLLGFMHPSHGTFNVISNLKGTIQKRWFRCFFWWMGFPSWVMRGRHGDLGHGLGGVGGSSQPSELLWCIGTTLCKSQVCRGPGNIPWLYP